MLGFKSYFLYLFSVDIMVEWLLYKWVTVLISTLKESVLDQFCNAFSVIVPDTLCTNEA